LKWENEIDYPLIVVREDKEDVTVHQVEALVQYYQDVLQLEMRKTNWAGRTLDDLPT
jgi:hypothetical protein